MTPAVAATLAATPAATPTTARTGSHIRQVQAAQPLTHPRKVLWTLHGAHSSCHDRKGLPTAVIILRGRGARRVILYSGRGQKHRQVALPALLSLILTHSPILTHSHPISPTPTCPLPRQPSNPPARGMGLPLPSTSAGADAGAVASAAVAPISTHPSAR